MGKSKKIPKGKGDESESENEVDTQELIEKEKNKKSKTSKSAAANEDLKKENSSKSENKKQKSKKEKLIDSEESEPEVVVTKVKKSFALLQIDDGDSEDEEPPEVDSESDSNRDEDIEKVLAELEMEYTGKKKEEEPPSVKTVDVPEVEEKEKKSKKTEKEPSVEPSADETKSEDTGTVKTAAQKKKEKKEREKQKKLVQKKEGPKEETVAETPEKEKSEETPKEENSEEKKEEGEDQDGDKKSKKKKKKGAKDEEDKEAKDAKKDEERQKKEEEERIKREEEAEQARLEALRLEQERKERKKQKEKERKERLKAEGKLDGIARRWREETYQTWYQGRPSKLKKDQAAPKPEEPLEPKPEEQPVVESPKVDEPVENKQEPEEEEDVKDAWDASSSSEEEESEEVAKAGKQPAGANKKEEEEDEESGSEEEEDSDSEEDSESESEDDGKTRAEKVREKALERIRARKEEAEKNKTSENLRAAIVCVLGHVDTGKTKILDKLRRTNVQDGEAGGITQQIGATNVPIDAIKEQIKIVREINQLELKIPGLLIIDTPGHESFSNLRNRGSSLCDIAILVVDIMHGLEPQTIESINILKGKKTPFIVALNKIDRLYDWQTMNRKDVRDILKAQAQNTQLEFEQRSKEVMVQFAEQDETDQASHVFGRVQATVLEVKAIPGLGTTIDVILVNGTLREGDTMLCAGTDGAIVTQIRSLLMPEPLRELRVKNAYVEYREIKAAQGVKIAAKELEKAIAGLNLYIANKPDEVEILKEEVSRELKSALSNIRLADRGVYVQASTLGSLEALLEFLRTSKIPYSNIRIGPVVKKDVMKASIMLEHESQYATILAFDVKIERDAQELADSVGVKIFQADIIYHLFDKFMAYREELKQRKREEFKHIAVFPCKLKILPQFVFNSRDPIVAGVMIEAGIVREGTPICVPSKDFVDIGVVTSIENNHKSVESARKGMEVCIKIEPVPGESPKMFGRHFDETDFLVSKISRQSIDACKDYFRDDLAKTDWQLMVELKKLFQIL
ncbi:hypothetical protein JTB14_032667 [Gonioctena quinquepunctata]|nr:hypothetical protein JTB14_032667 [Gonioctena quinquepunctata]